MSPELMREVYERLGLAPRYPEHRLTEIELYLRDRPECHLDGCPWPACGCRDA